MEKETNETNDVNVRKRVTRRLPPGVRPVKKVELFTGKAPEIFEWGWTKMPIVSRILISGTFLSALALGLPYWVNIHWDGHKAHFGLFAYCLGEIGAKCTSIHDNLVPDRDVPLWYHFTQVSFFIGTTCGTLAMFVVYSNHQGRYLMIPPTTRSMAVLMLMVAVIQLSVSIYTFITYFEHTDFLYEGHREVYFHGAFYCAVLGDFCYVVGALMLLLDTSSKPPLNLKKKLALRKHQETQLQQKQEQKHGQTLKDFAVPTQVKQSEQLEVDQNVKWPEPSFERPEKSGLSIGQTLVKVVDPDSVYHYTAQDYIVKHTADQDLDLPALARATGGVNISPTKVLSKCSSHSDSNKVEKQTTPKTEKKVEDRKQERVREEQKKKEDDLPPWVRYHNLHSGDPHRHCQCIHNQQWHPVAARVVANQPQLGTGPKIKEIS